MQRLHASDRPIAGAARRRSVALGVALMRRRASLGARSGQRPTSRWVPLGTPQPLGRRCAADAGCGQARSAGATTLAADHARDGEAARAQPNHGAILGMLCTVLASHERAGRRIRRGRVPARDRRRVAGRCGQASPAHQGQSSPRPTDQAVGQAVRTAARALRALTGDRVEGGALPSLSSGAFELWRQGRDPSSHGARLIEADDSRRTASVTRPRFTRLRKNAVQKARSSDGPTSRPRTWRSPVLVTPTATTVA